MTGFGKLDPTNWVGSALSHYYYLPQRGFAILGYSKMATAGNSRHISGRDKMAAFVYRHFRFGLGRCARREMARNEGGPGFPGTGFRSGLDSNGGPTVTVSVQGSVVSHTIGPRPERSGRRTIIQKQDIQINIPGSAGVQQVTNFAPTDALDGH